MRAVTVTAERGDGAWVLESDNGAISQVHTLSQAKEEMREAVAHLAGLPESEVEIVLEVIRPDTQGW
ncbi:MAG: hypothetical protein E7L00_00210 [Propionibacteriaceae bacterium]|nr:hypothetical protein [Propionibacteriaceae bacterium]